jgi:hypothetical protein
MGISSQPYDASSESIPSTPTTSKRAMEAFQAPLVAHLLLPHGDVRAVISHVGVEWREGSSEYYEGRLLRLKVGLVGCARPLGGHAEDMGWRDEDGGGKRKCEASLARRSLEL